MLDNGAGSLTMDEIPIRESVFKHRHNRVAIVRRLWSDVFEDERQCLQTSGSDVEFGRAIFR